MLVDLHRQATPRAQSDGDGTQTHVHKYGSFSEIGFICSVRWNRLSDNINVFTVAGYKVALSIRK
ncbi:TPA: hypothetical protein EYN23_12155 [Candidatus Poribacteria bacterium]|nr:hypothetical protein [Candidatus Poribacteria bacterium]